MFLWRPVLKYLATSGWPTRDRCCCTILRVVHVSSPRYNGTALACVSGKMSNKVTPGAAQRPSLLLWPLPVRLYRTKWLVFPEQSHIVQTTLTPFHCYVPRPPSPTTSPDVPVIRKCLEVTAHLIPPHILEIVQTYLYICKCRASPAHS